MNIDHTKIENNFELRDYFGDWIHQSEQELRESFQNTKPSYIIIDNFLTTEYAEKVFQEFPVDFHDRNWHKYENPIEVKYANNNIASLKENLQKLFYILSAPKVVDKFSKVTGISNLEYDEYLHGAGIHAHPRNGRLNIHLDYEKHPISNKQRRINIILYLTKDWNDEWNGQTELWNEIVTEKVASSPVRFNTAIVFQTNEISWHGLPEKILCPENVFRKSFAYYYVSPLESESDSRKYGANEEGYRTKASFIKRPQDPESDKMSQLYQIRMHRRIEPEDMQSIWPEWNAVDY
jgi:Rps23 Pro-64 3,4-dihydroxylase Tpa1-like proline 4-hydroxylase